MLSYIVKAFHFSSHELLMHKMPIIIIIIILIIIIIIIIISISIISISICKRETHHIR